MGNQVQCCAYGNRQKQPPPGLSKQNPKKSSLEQLQYQTRKDEEQRLKRQKQKKVQEEEERKRREEQIIRQTLSYETRRLGQQERERIIQNEKKKVQQQFKRRQKQQQYQSKKIKMQQEEIKIQRVQYHIENQMNQVEDKIKKNLLDIQDLEQKVQNLVKAGQKAQAQLLFQKIEGIKKHTKNLRSQHKIFGSQKSNITTIFDGKKQKDVLALYTEVEKDLGKENEELDEMLDNIQQGRAQRKVMKNNFKLIQQALQSSDQDSESQKNVKFQTFIKNMKREQIKPEGNQKISKKRQSDKHHQDKIAKMLHSLT